MITLNASYQSKKECLDIGLDVLPLRLRLIRVELDSGEVEVLITSRTDKERYPERIFKDLYHLRWPVEVDYLFMKERLQVENFSGGSALSVYQDFHSKIFTKNLIWVLASPTEEAVKQASAGNKHEQQLNMTQAISKSKDTLILLFEKPIEMIVSLIQQIHAVFMDATEPIRPGRKFKRKHKVNKREYHMNLKPQYHKTHS